MICAATANEEVTKQSAAMLPMQMSRRLREVDDCPPREGGEEEEEEGEVKMGTKRPPSLQTTGLVAVSSWLDLTRQILLSPSTASITDACMGDRSAGSTKRRDRRESFGS